jgi:hypothetical protein
MEIADLKNAVIGVDATAYLQHIITGPPSEPLLAALGGDPLTLKQQISDELDRWKGNEITPLFVFDGQSNVGKNEVALRKAKEGLAQTQKAWNFYGDTRPETAVQTFGASGMVLPNLLGSCANISQELSEHKTYTRYFRKSSLSGI